MNQEATLQKYAPQVPVSISQMAMDIQEVQRQTAMINNLIKSSMVEATKGNHYSGHYGIIPGTKKRALFKQGAEKIAFMFRLGAKYTSKVEDLGNGQINVVVETQLIHIPTQTPIGFGVGSCSTLESKYRYRTGPTEFTGEPVPREYWELRKDDPKAAQALIGGPGRTTKKNPESGHWEICLQGEKIDNPDPADQWNTALKMAKKRSYVDAVMTATAASDIFDKGAVDAAEAGLNGNGADEQPPRTHSYPPKNGNSGQQNQRQQSYPASDKQLKCIYAITRGEGIDPDVFKIYLRDNFGVGSTKDLTSNQASDIINDLKSGDKFVTWLENQPINRDQQEFGEEAGF